MDEGSTEEFKGFPIQPSDRTHRNVPRTLLHRDTGFRQRHNGVPIEFQWAAEDKLVLKDYEEMKCQLPGVPTRSTFLMVFSPDGKRVASTHGNHNIYVTDLTSGKNIKTLTGHPRTPWCIAFHPSSNQILASGCLGGQVRVWDLHGGSEVWITKSQTVIASIAFHPTERMLVIATYNELYFWDWSQSQPYAKTYTSNEKEKVRYVSFDPLGCKLITGISNAPAVTSQWDRVGPPTTAGNPAQAQGASTSAGLPHDPDQRRITICYRSLVEQYEQLVQRYYDLTRSRATPTMDRGTDPMDVDEASRLRNAGSQASSHADSHAGMRWQQRPGCRMVPVPSRASIAARILANSGTQPSSSQASSGTQPRSSQASSSQASSSQTGPGPASNVPCEQHARWRGWMSTNRFCQTGISHTASQGTQRGSETVASTGNASDSTLIGSGLVLVESPPSIHDSNAQIEQQATLEAFRNRSAAIGSSSTSTTATGTSSSSTATVGTSSLDTGTIASSTSETSPIVSSPLSTTTIGSRSLPTMAVGPCTMRTSTIDSSSMTTPVVDLSSTSATAIDLSSMGTSATRSTSSATAATSPPIAERDSRFAGSFLEQNRNRRSYGRDSSISRRNFMRLVREHHRLYCSPRRDNPETAGQTGASSGQATPNSEDTRGERRSPSHIRTYDVSRTGPVLPSFSSEAEPPQSPERPRRFFFSQRSAFQPQAPRSAATEQSYAFLEERARRLDNLTRGLYQRRGAGRTPPPPPPPPPHETADIGVRYGIQLLSRHIDNMQRLCRARLEILQLQQIRRMWEDLQLQIRSLHVASRGAGSDPPPPLPPRRYPPSDSIPTSRAAGEFRSRFDFYRYLGCRSQQPSRLSRTGRRSAEQRRSVAWRHYSGRRPGQDAPSYRHRAGADAVTTTESSTQSGVGDEGDATVESSASNGAASGEAAAEAEGTARGTKRNRGEMEAEVPAEAPAAEVGGVNEAQPTADQGRTTTQSLRSMIARLESLVRQQRDQREHVARAHGGSVMPGVDRQDAPPPAPGVNLSAEERLASALQNEEYESGRLYRSTLGRQSRLEDWEFARESTRLRARQVLSLMVESLTQFFEENGLSHNTPHAVLDDQIYNLFILLQLALELTDLLLAQLASTRRELEHQWVHRLRSPVALEASETASFREEAHSAGRHLARRGRHVHCTRRPLFHPRAPPGSDSGSARTAGTVPDGAGHAGTASNAANQTSRPLLSFRRFFSHDLQLLPVARPSSSAVSSHPSQAQGPQGMREEGTRVQGTRVQGTRVQGNLSRVSPPQSSPPQSSVPQSSPPSGDAAPPITRQGPERRGRFVRVPRTPRFGTADAFGVQDRPAERRHDEREFMVQVRRYQNAAPPVPAVRVNDILVADPSAMGQPQSRPRAQQPWTLPTYGDADPEAGPWRPQRFLHPRYRLEQAAPDTPYEIAGGGEGFNILRVMGPAFATEHVVLADSPVMPNHRIQAWDFTHKLIPDITDVEKNIVAAECKIHNDASVDVSSDGKLLVTLLPSGRLSMTTMLGIYSLQWETLGQCLYTTRFDQNAVSVSLSPVSRHLLVGLASRRVGAIMTDLHTMAQIFRLDKVGGPVPTGTPGGALVGRGRLCHLRDIEQGREQPFMSINCIRWAPVAGQGLVFGTNNGQLKVLR